METEDRIAQLLGGDRRRLRVGAAVVLVLAAIAGGVLVAALSSAGPTSVVPAVAVTRSAEAPAPVVLVHVLGAVQTPGLYSLPEGARVVDAVAAAGGLAADADPAAVNLARRVADGEQLRVPAIGEAPPPGATAAPDAPGARVDLNTATAEQLATLPRIGPALAARIVEWREQNGSFSSADDLLEVSGVGQKTVDGLRELVLP